MSILLADDHAMFRDSIGQWLQRSESDFRVDTVDSLDAAKIFLQQHEHIQLLMLDLCMPGMQGAESIHDILHEWENLRILIISANEDAVLIRNCIQAGASGYAPKSLDGDALLEAIHIVMSGHIYLPKNVRLINADTNFSERQMDVLRMLAEGESNKAIAEQLCLAESTAKQYVSDILNRLGVNSRFKAGLRARQLLGMGS